MTVASNQITVATSAPVNEVQTLTITATGGTFTLAYDGGTATSAQNYNVTSANLKTALVATGSFATGDLTITGDGPHVITFTGAYAATNVALLTLTTGSLTGGSASIVQTTPGSPRTSAVRLDSLLADEELHGSSELKVANTGSATVYLGGASVTTSTGYRLAASASLQDIPLRVGDGLYGIVADGATTTVDVLETA